MNFIKKLLKDDDDDIYEDSKHRDAYNEIPMADNSGIGSDGVIIDDIPPVSSETAQRPTSGVKTAGAKAAGGSVSLRVMKPKSYDDGPEIADYIAAGCTVVMNIEELNRENARRLIDFLLGAVHVLGGDLQMASQTTFVVAPCSVGVGDDDDESTGSVIGDGFNFGK